MSGKNIAALTACVVGALYRDEPDQGTTDEVQRRVMLTRAVGEVVLADALLAVFDIRDSLKALQKASQ